MIHHMQIRPTNTPKKKINKNIKTTLLSIIFLVAPFWATPLRSMHASVHTIFNNVWKKYKSASVFVSNPTTILFAKNGNKYSDFGGLKDPGETPWVTAKREFSEEIIARETLSGAHGAQFMEKNVQAIHVQGVGHDKSHIHITYDVAMTNGDMKKVMNKFPQARQTAKNKKWGYQYLEVESLKQENNNQNNINTLNKKHAMRSGLAGSLKERSDTSNLYGTTQNHGVPVYIWKSATQRSHGSHAQKSSNHSAPTPSNIKSSATNLPISKHNIAPYNPTRVLVPLVGLALVGVASWHYWK